MADNIRANEEQNLNRCLSRIDEIIAEDRRWLGRTKEDAPVFGEAAREWRQRKEQEIRNLQEVRPKPYFGRVDFIPDNLPDETKTYYFGEYHIPEVGEPLTQEQPNLYVLSYWAPISRLFYNPQSGGYNAPSGKVTGTVIRKRELLIEQARLLKITEYPLLPPGVKPPLPEEAPLTRELSKPKGDELMEIIATIQPEQYEEIAATPYRVMIIQGVAGSGKSEVGLHRIAYLLSPYNELDLKISPDGVAFFGPSRVFLKYISNLLPGLGVGKVHQLTIRDWLLGSLSRRVKLERMDGLLEKQLSGTKKELEGDIRVAKLKVSLRMARILDRHLKIIRNGFIDNATSLLKGQEVAISEARVKKIIRGSQHRPLNEQRKLALSHIEEELQSEVLTKIEDSERADIEAQFEKFWPELDFREVYLDLLSDRNALITASKGSTTEEEAELLCSSLSQKRKSFRTEDLPVLCYIDQLLNEQSYTMKKKRIIPPFEHVVIDEAQDVSPLEYLLLYRYSSNKSFTILGDIGQCLLPHRGITGWREVKQIFSKENAYQWDARVSYRATYEITKYANRILKVVAPGMHKAIPYNRHGEKPTFIRSKSYADMVTAIVKDIKSLQAQGIQTIAVLCKTSKEASKMQQMLVKEGITDAVRLDKPSYERTKIAISSIYLTKGLEYDAVILADARTSKYTGSVLHNRLLYIAITRAAHLLHVHWFGTLAEVLVDPTLLPKTKKTKARDKHKKGKKSDKCL